AKVLTRLFRRADLHEGILPVPTAIHLALKLQADGKVKTAAALIGAVAEWLQRSGLEMRLIRGNCAVMWAIARELSLLPASFPPPMRTAIALAALAVDLGQAKSDLIALGKRQPNAGRAAADQLRESAPMLAATFADALDP